MGVKDDPEKAPRRGCVCVLFITETDGTQARSYARCLEHKRIARQNHVSE